MKKQHNASFVTGLSVLGFSAFACGGGADNSSAESPLASTGAGAAAGRPAVVSVGSSSTGFAGSGTTPPVTVPRAPLAGAGGSRGPVDDGHPRGAAGAGMHGGAGASGMASAGAGAGAAGSGHAAAGGGASAPGQIWMPKPGVSWQWQLTGKLDTSIDAEMYDIDLFNTSAADMQALHGAGRVVVCYFSAGSYEPDRPDSDALSKTGLGSVLDGWPDEKWLDIRSAAVRDAMTKRLDLAKSQGCEGVEPDNVDGFDNDNGLGLTKDDQVDYNKFLASEAHARGLSVGLKNSLGLVSSLVTSFDWALNEECLKYDECDALEPFISAGKAVFHCEYAMSTNNICGKAPQGFSTIIKDLDLDAFRLTCN